MKKKLILTTLAACFLATTVWGTQPLRRPFTVKQADGTTLTPAYYDEVWSQRAGWVMWEFEAPIDPDQVISVTLNGETLPID